MASQPIPATAVRIIDNVEPHNPSHQDQRETLAPAVPGSAEYANYKRLVDRTVDVFGDEIIASVWLSIPNSDLDGQSPLQAAQKSGYRTDLIEPILIRIEHGIFP